MKSKYYLQILSLILSAGLLGLFSACSKTSDAAQETGMQPKPMNEEAELAEVRILPLEMQVFDYQIEAAGKIESANLAELRFRQPGFISKIYLQNGQSVRPGETIAELDNVEQLLNLRKAENQYAIAREAYIRELVEFGGNHLKPDVGIDPELHERIKHRSGLHTATLEIEQAKLNLEFCKLQSPVAGIIADMQLRSGNFIGATQAACAVYAPDRLELVLDVLESELPLLQKGQRARLYAIGRPGEYYEALVSDINPRVAGNGMLKVRLQILNPRNLYVGMNARATIFVPQHRTLAVPREAVVLRSGKKVVFTEENGQAKWNYVSTGLENVNLVEVIEGLKSGDRVIIDNNLQLAHNSPVKVKQN